MAAVPIHSAPTSADLVALDELIGDSRIVMIGEQWHGDGGTIRLRGNLIQHLHEHLGFNVVAFEADFFGLNALGNSTISAESVTSPIRNVYPFWGNVPAAAPFWSYVAQQSRVGHPLQVTGFDVRHQGQASKDSLTALAERKLRNITSVSSSARVNFVRTLQELVTLDRQSKADSVAQGNFLSTLDSLEVRANHGDSADLTNEFWRQELRNIRNLAGYSWHGDSRDAAMAQNFVWLATHRYPSDKIVIWAHNNHIITDHWMYFDSPDSTIRTSTASMSQESKGYWTYFGEGIKRFFGKQVVSIATIVGSGNYSPDISEALMGKTSDFHRLVEVPQPSSSSLEGSLMARGLDTALIDLRPFRDVHSPIAARALDYVFSHEMRMRYWQGYDGILFLRHTVGLNQSP